jgi:peptidoglycan hydrolase-like protein with peptidoglycan-binding domain
MGPKQGRCYCEFIVNELVATSDSEIVAPVADRQAPGLTGFSNTLSKEEIELIQKRLKTAGFDPGPTDGDAGPQKPGRHSRSIALTIS